MSGMLMNQVYAEKRSCDRVGVSRKINISLADGDSLDGVTMNISLGGILLKPGRSVGGQYLGTSASFTLICEFGVSSVYLCKIIRISDGLISLEVDKKAAVKFGKELTRGIFARK
jgi:hypothetical protein